MGWVAIAPSPMAPRALHVMAILVVEFQVRRYKIRLLFLKSEQIQGNFDISKMEL